MKIRARSISLLITAVVMAGFAAPADAQAFLYAGKRKRINCGVVWIDPAKPLSPGMDNRGYPVSGGGVGDLFFLLDQRVDMKPPGWSFDNPLAPGGPATGLAKSDPLYWQVDLRSAPDLSRMHVLYLPAHGNVNMTAQDREKLRQFVDGGGVLWIDNEGSAGQLDFGQSFFILNFTFQAASGSEFPVSRHHPLLTLPFWLNDWDIVYLGANPGSAGCKPGYDPGVGAWLNVNDMPNFDVLYPVISKSGASGLPSVAANAYGSGRIVATANYVGRGCYTNLSSLKFAYNVIAWSSSWTHLRKDPRHSGGSIDTVGGTKLVEVWSLPVPASGGATSPNGYAPVIYKNIVFYTSGSTIFALDLAPQEDLDHDGYPDDGYQGVGSLINKGQDVVWYYTADGNLSAPSVVTVCDPSNPSGSVEVVMTVSSAGTVYLLPAFPVDANLRFEQDMSRIGPFFTWKIGKPNPDPGPPLYVNGWIYTTGGDGRLYAYSPCIEAWKNADANRKGDFKWEIPTLDLNVQTETAGPRTGPNFGYVTSDSSGATVGMVYWFTTAWTNSVVTSGQERNDMVCGVPVHVGNDRVRFERAGSTNLIAQYRITYSQAMVSEAPAPVAFIRRADGTDEPAEVVPNSVLQADTPVPQPVNDKGHVIVKSTSTPLTPTTVVHVTYALDYVSGDGIKTSFPTRARQPLEPRSTDLNGAPQTTVASLPAMGPDNMIYIAGKRDGTNPPAIYGISSDSTQQVSRWIYLLHSGVNPNLISGQLDSSVPIPGVVYNPETGASMTELKVSSSPAVWGDKVFVTVSGTPGPDPNTGQPDPRTAAALLCFKANSNFLIRLTDSAGSDFAGGSVKKPKKLRDPVTGREKQIMLWQPNLAGSGSTTPAMPLQTARAVRREMVDYEKGTITFNNFDQMKLLGGALNVQATNCFSPSLPVFVFVDNVPVPIDWSTWGPTKDVWPKAAPGQPFPVAAGDSVDLSGWNNLLWFYLIPPHAVPNTDPVQYVPCSGIDSSPVVIGNNVYFTCRDGRIFGYPAEPGETGGGAADKNLLVWEETISEAGAPVGQAGPGPSLSMAGSNGVLLAPTVGGLHAFTNATTLVADANRLCETDGAGEVKWSLGSISWPVSASADTTTSGPINKPSRARYLSSGEMLLVNSGSSQVCRMDKNGNVVAITLNRRPGSTSTTNYDLARALYDRFVDPKNLLRPGQPTTLSSPTDAVFWIEYEREGSVTRRVDHCVIADSGNHRVLDLVYRFNLDQRGNALTFEVAGQEQPDPSTGFILPELNWVSITDSTNERYVYDSIQVASTPTGGQDIWAAVSNYRGSFVPVNKVQTEGLGGAVFSLGYRVPGSGGAWNYSHDDAGRIVAACDRIVDPSGTTVPLACPRFFQIIDRPPTSPTNAGGRFIIICDNYGVYEVGPLGGGVPPIRRAFRDQDYRVYEREMKYFHDGSIAGNIPGGLGVPLQATGVQELMNGNWLITSSYSGSNTAGNKSFSGEAFEISWVEAAPGSGLYTFGGVEWSSPPLFVLSRPGPGNTVLPDWPTWKQRLENSYIFQQPRSAVRQM